MNSIEVDQEKLKEIYIEARIKESEFIKTGRYTDKDMVNAIYNIIDRHVNKEMK